MNVFIGIAALLTLLVVAWFVRPLLSKPRGSGVSSDKLNASIYRDQLLALEKDLARGVINQHDFEITRDELQVRLLDDTENTDVVLTTHTGFLTAKRTAIAISLSVPVFAIGIYMLLGEPSAMSPAAQQAKAAPVDDQQIRQMIDTLAAKLKANPDNPQGWAMLARSYKVVGQNQEAQLAYEKAGAFVNGNPDMLVDYAELLGIQAGNKLDGKPEKMIAEALKLNPEHPMGLMLAGVALYQRSDFAGALSRWEKLLSMLPPGSEDAQQVQANIDDARSKAGLPAATQSNALPPVPAGAAAGMTPDKINEMVDRLAAKLKANPGDLPGWARLARAYKVQGRLDEAAQAYAKTGKLMDTDPDLMTQYADLLATRAKSMQGKPTELVNKALTLAPKHPMALMMAGQAAYQAGKFDIAVEHWQTALSVLPPGSPDIEPLRSEIADATLKIGSASK
jgi:cytochrome c-type biogenesis protein CcmH